MNQAVECVDKSAEVAHKLGIELLISRAGSLQRKGGTDVTAQLVPDGLTAVLYTDYDGDVRANESFGSAQKMVERTSANAAVITPGPTGLGEFGEYDIYAIQLYRI